MFMDFMYSVVYLRFMNESNLVFHLLRSVETRLYTLSQKQNKKKKNEHK